MGVLNQSHVLGTREGNGHVAAKGGQGLQPLHRNTQSSATSAQQRPAQATCKRLDQLASTWQEQARQNHSQQARWQLAVLLAPKKLLTWSIISSGLLLSISAARASQSSWAAGGASTAAAFTACAGMQAEAWARLQACSPRACSTRPLVHGNLHPGCQNDCSSRHCR